MERRRKPGFDKLYGHIMLLFLIVLIPAIVLGIYSYFHTESTALTGAEQRIHRQVASAVQEIDKRLEDLSAMYQVLTSYEELRALDLDGALDAATAHRLRNAASLFGNLLLMNDSLQEIALYTGGERVVSSNGIFPAEYYFTDFFRFDRYPIDSWQILAAGRNNMRYLEPTELAIKTVNRYTSHSVIPVISSFTMNQGRGLLVFVINAQNLLETLDQYVPYTRTAFAIYTADERPIAATPVEEKDRPTVSFTYTSPQSGWIYVAEVSRDEITVASRQMLTQVLAIIVSVLAFGILLVILVSRQMYQPLRNIQNMLREELDAPSTQSNSLERLEEQVSTLMQSSSSNETQLNALARSYAESVFLSQAMTEKRAAMLETIMTRCLGFHGGPYQCAAIRFTGEAQGYEDAVLEIVGKHFPVCSLGYSDAVTLYVFELGTLQERAVIDSVAAELFRLLPGAIAGIAVGSEIADVQELHRSLNASLTVLQHVGGEDRNVLLYSEDFDIANQYVYTHRDEWQLVEALQRNDGEAVHHQLDGILLRNYEKCVAYQQIQHLFEQLRSTAYRYAQQENILLLAHLPDRTGAFDISRMELHQLYDILLLDGDTKTRNTHVQLAKDADAYILAHYEDDIYLESIARALGVSAKHLSRVYKQHRGINISDQVCAVRIDRAKQLLANTDLPIQEIMRQTGFISRATFLRSFRKYADISPSAFRHIHNPAMEDKEEDDDV